ncbi:lipoprotein [Clostridia bacterium]|nr:lipoprotein [Clostridia bacterium]
MKRLAILAAAALILLSVMSACVSEGAASPSPSPSAPVSDAVSNASPEKETTDPAQVGKSLSKDGQWILSLLGDVTLTSDLTVEGTFYDAHNDQREYRKLALYAQDADRKVTAKYTLTVPKITVKSPNFYIWNGTVKGDIYVEANNFTLYNATVEGNITFATQEYRDSARLNEGEDSSTDPATKVGTDGKVTGDVTVAG